MKSFAKTRAANEVEYPSSDGKPMAETEFHLTNMLEVIGQLKRFFEEAADVYACGNMLMYYVPGDKRKHVSPDIFVVCGIDKRIRENYLVWEEGKGPDLVIELTSASTKREDLETKFKLYRDVLKVHEYFLFDPQSEYLAPAPSMQGYRLLNGQYARIRPVKGRLPSKVLGLHLERDGTELRLFDPASAKWLRTTSELNTDLQKSEAEIEKTEAELQQTEAELQQTEAELQQTEAELQKTEAELRKTKAELQKSKANEKNAEDEIEKLRRELAALREEKD